MNSKVVFLRILSGFLVLLMAAPPAVFAQGRATVEYSREELDQMLAPIALYPDSLLAQVLMASTFPDQVADAAVWVRQHEDLRGDALNAALDGIDWDLSVKALVPFPRVLAMMSDKMDWTRRMGDAFLDQEARVMDTVQKLRSRAYAQGNLRTTEQQRVMVRGETIEIVPVNPQVVYVPVYNPLVIYGSWWYPSYPPYAYNPYYPNYVYDPYYTGPGLVVTGLFGFAAGVAVGSWWHSGWGHWDWRHRDVYVNVHRNININRFSPGRHRYETARWRSVSRHRNDFRRGGSAYGQYRDRRGTHGTGLTGPGKPPAASAQRELQRRERNERMSRDNAAAERNRTRMGEARRETGRSRPSELASPGRSGVSRESRDANIRSHRPERPGGISRGDAGAFSRGSREAGIHRARPDRHGGIGRGDAGAFRGSRGDAGAFRSGGTHRDGAAFRGGARHGTGNVSRGGTGHRGGNAVHGGGSHDRRG